MIPYCTIWYHIVQYGSILYNMVPYCTIWYHIVQYGIILYNMVSYCTIWYHIVQYGIILYNMVSYYYIVQYGIILYNMVSYCTIWYHIVQYGIFYRQNKLAKYIFGILDIILRLSGALLCFRASGANLLRRIFLDRSQKKSIHGTETRTIYNI